ncbi:hypothetical protein [uncultured Sphingomonas sp.]|uniref:hypothetical protein n=1 Tax=uncultured Sphingomonas sp. TaxID=158754 RepID=UPI0035C99C88
MADLRISATIPVGKTADWVAVTRDRVWIGSTGPNAVNEVDPATNAVIRVEVPGRPCGGLTADATSLWVPLCGPVPQLARVDLKTRALRGVFPVGPPAGEGGVAVGGGSVWLVTDKAGSLARVDPGSGAVTQVIQLPTGSYNPVFSRGRLWVTRAEGAELTVVDPGNGPAGGKVAGSVATGGRPRFLAAGSGAVWTLNQLDGSLSRVDAAARRASPPLPLETPGPGGDVAFDGRRIWTTMMKTPLTAVDARTGTLLCQWKGEGGDSLNVGHGAIWLTNLRAGTASRIELKDVPADCAAGGARR